MLEKSASAVFAQAVPADRAAISKLLLDGQVSVVLELAQLRSQAPIGFSQKFLQSTKRKHVIAREQDADRQPHSMFE